MEANKNKNLGNAGEFYVLAQLAQRGYIAGKTDDGTTLIDVIATNPDNLSTVNIQVKTRTIDGKRSSWMMGKKMSKYIRIFGMSQLKLVQMMYCLTSLFLKVLKLVIA